MDDDSLGTLIALAASAGALLLWWAIGRAVEKRHLASLARRESLLSGIVLDSRREPEDPDPAFPPSLVTAEVVIASDGFKTWVFSLRNLFGGESRTFTGLFARARREATVRLLEAARAQGADAVCNLRFDSADIAGNAAAAQGKKSKPMACCTVSGTAYRRRSATDV